MVDSHLLEYYCQSITGGRGCSVELRVILDLRFAQLRFSDDTDVWILGRGGR